MTHESQRPSWLVIVPPPVWALAFILAAWVIGKGLGLDAPFRNAVAGWVVFALGFVIAASGRLAFARAGTEVRPASPVNSVLVTAGPFRFTRNPMYLGILAAMAGLSLVIGTIPSLLSVVLWFLFVNFISIPYEEEKMERQFGDAYGDYKTRVRRWV